MKHFLVLLFILMQTTILCSQDINISGKVIDENNEPIAFANVILTTGEDNKLAKVEVTNETGKFQFQSMNEGIYTLTVKFLGYEDYIKADLNLSGESIDVGVLQLNSTSIELEEAQITAERAMVEMKSDRTVFNVQGTINSAGDDGLELLRKAPGVVIDNNNNINVMSRSGVLVYVDGKRLPIEGQDLTNYLQNLTADQIDRIDIITSPGAKYEAEGNAGIIDIIMKKDESIGTNGSLSLNASQGIAGRAGISGTANYRNKRLNVFGSLGHTFGERYNRMDFINNQNSFIIDEIAIINNQFNNTFFRLGTDFFASDNHTLGFLVSGNLTPGSTATESDMEIFSSPIGANPDSILIANNETDSDRIQMAYNINYRFQKDKTLFNFDIDYGLFNADRLQYQPNVYYAANRVDTLSTVITQFDSPSDIGIFSTKFDYETPLWRGKIGAGAKFNNVQSDNYFKFYDIENGQEILNRRRTNDFFYDENVYAAYVTFNQQLTDKLSFNAGLRTEYTDVTGDLVAYVDSLQEDLVELNYLQWFPNAGINYQLHPQHSMSLSFSKRINRPNYEVLNPFNKQLSELSYQKGNSMLNPEIVHNIELGYTAFYRYSMRLSFSKTFDQITRLIGPDDEDPRASFITYANLAEQEIYSASVSLPFQFNKWWSAFMNFSGGYQHNMADYGENGTVDVSTYTYNIYQQHSFDVYKGLKFEASGWYNGPGIWGGVFRFDPSWALGLGVQKRFLSDRLLVKFSVQDIFRQAYWTGESNFNGLISTGEGDWDSRRAKLAVSYSFGSNKVKAARKRETGIEKEQERLQSSGGQ